MALRHREPQVPQPPAPDQKEEEIFFVRTPNCRSGCWQARPVANRRRPWSNNRRRIGNARLARSRVACAGSTLSRAQQESERESKGMADFDLAIIGGGINGAGIARDAAGRGLKVVLVEQNDLASGTSSASSKLIHGGLRYLEHGAFRLVRAALGEREMLLRMAPHLIRPLRFVLPLDPASRSPIVLRLGLLVYDLLGRREILPGTRSLDLITDAAGQPLKRQFPSRLRIFRLLRRRCAAGGAQCSRRRRARRGDPHPHTLCPRRAGDVWRLVLHSRGARDVVTRACVGQRSRGLGGNGRRDGFASAAVRPATARQGQPYRRARGCTITIAPTFCRHPTAGSCSPFPFSATLR